MKKLHEADIEKIEKFMKDECFQSVDFMFASFKRLREFARKTQEEIIDLDTAGDLE